MESVMLPAKNTVKITKIDPPITQLILDNKTNYKRVSPKGQTMWEAEHLTLRGKVNLKVIFPLPSF